MNSRNFWSQVESCEGDPQAFGLMLSRLQPAELAALGRTWTRHIAPLRNARLWWQAYLASRGFKDFKFQHFTAWVVLKGKDVYALALQPAEASGAPLTENLELLHQIDPRDIAAVRDVLRLLEKPQP